MARERGLWRGWQAIAIGVAAAVLALSLVGIRGALASPGGSGGQAQISRTISVDINHFAYHPPTLRIAKGTTVAFSNSSHVTHTATRRGSFTTGRIKPGRSILIKFSHKGAFAYHCEIHPFMHGKIIVE
jgi:plastocyanin